MLTVCLLAALLAIPAEAAPAAEAQPALAYDVYLKLDGINGESTFKNYEKWIVLSGVQFDVGNTSDIAKGGREGAGKSVLNHFTITKRFDAASIPLFLSVLMGSHIKNGQIAFVTRGEAPKAFLTVDLADILVSDYKFNNTCETIRLKFGSIQLNYYMQKPDGSLNAPITGGWDFTDSKKN